LLKVALNTKNQSINHIEYSFDHYDASMWLLFYTKLKNFSYEYHRQTKVHFNEIVMISSLY
jgi:hypothetical protein